jgi:hypothetical protein
VLIEPLELRFKRGEDHRSEIRSGPYGREGTDAADSAREGRADRDPGADA